MAPKNHWNAMLVCIINLASLCLCDVSDSIESFTNVLENSMCSDGLSVGGTKCSNQDYGIQDFINSFSDYFDNEIINASIKAQSIIDRLNTAINLRATMLYNISDQIQTLCNQYHSSGDTSIGIFDTLYFSGNAEKDSLLPNDIHFNEAYGNNVSLTTSSFKIPNDVDSTNEIVQFDATISSLLTNVMLDLHSSYCMEDTVNIYCVIYFGMTSGVFRQYPASENARDEDGVYKSYDPRYRPWYVAAASGSKDIMILLDISGSMALNNRMSIAKSAVLSVLNTLTSNSMVNIVAFSSEITMSCFQDNFVRATEKNINVLTDFVSNLHSGGGTDFIGGFEKVFDLFDAKQATYGSNCYSSILFLTDGISDDPSHIITQRNTDINAVIFSYTLGDGADVDIPKKVAELTNGNYKHIEDGDVNLISAMSSYYLYYANKDESTVSQMIFTSPYLDFDTNVIMITMALPVFINDTYFVGVVGADIPLTLFSDAIGDITIGRKSYSFVMNDESELLLHPSMGDPTDSSLSEYIPTYVTDVEPNEYLESDIFTNMIQRESGSQQIQANVKQSAGNVEYEGYVSISTNLLYIYGPIGTKSLSMALVIYTDSDITPPNVPSFGLINSPSTLCGQHFTNTNITNLTECIAPFNVFHEIDLMLECDSSWTDAAAILSASQHNYEFYDGMAISIEYPSFYLQHGLFEDSYLALNVDPSCDSLQELYELTNRIGISTFTDLPFGGFRSEISDSVLTSIYILSSLHEFWRGRFQISNSSFVAMYFASYIGIHLSYPAIALDTAYNSLLRPWYQRSVTYPHLFTFTTPYKDATTNKLVITGSSVIYAPDSTFAFGVAGFDFQYTQFIEFWSDIMSADCDITSQIYCYLIDASSFLVYYEGMEDDVDDEDINHKFFGDLEPTLFQSLLDLNVFTMNQTINFETDTMDTTYIIGDITQLNDDQSFEDNNGLYSIKPVNKTNLFIVIVDGYFRTSTYPQNCPYDTDCSDVYPPGCVKNSDDDNCASAQISACTEFSEGSNVVIASSLTCSLSVASNKNIECLTSICPTHTDVCYDEDDEAATNINMSWFVVGFVLTVI